MKKIILPIIMIVLGLSSCDFLDRMPKDKLAPENYFRNEQDLKLFSNSFYDNLFEKSPFELQSDIMFIKGDLGDELLGGSNRKVPESAGTSGWTWGQLRKINTMLGNMDKCEDPDAVKEYSALAKFFRARFYFEKVKRFGDVPWYDKELGSTDEDLYKARDSREFVMARMIEDIDEAIAGLPDGVSTYRVNKWAVLMLKAQFCLFEGTFRKYHGITFNEGRTADDYLTLAYQAAQQVMECPLYGLADDYGAMFRSVDANKKEYILAIKMDHTIGCVHDATGFTLNKSASCPGLSKKFVDSFLMKDGTFYSAQEGWETKTFVEQVANRDPRLGMIIRLPEYVRSNSKGTFNGPDLELTSTGYHIDKFVMDASIEIAERVNYSYNDIPVYRFAEAHLIYAEAKAELGIINQDDLDKSINVIRNRPSVKMPPLKMDVAVDPFLVSDKYGYTNLAKLNPANMNLILEIRRERTIELALEASDRWDDIRRWKEGKCYEQPMLGMYFPGPGEYDLTGDGVADVCLYKTSKEPETKAIRVFQIQEIEIDGKYVKYDTGLVLSEGDHGFVEKHRLVTREFREDRDYLYPIPSGDRMLNNNLTQNPGWNDGLNF